MTQISFVDLDDTLMQTLGKCPANAEVFAVAYDKTGQSLSYMTQEQRHFWDMLNKGIVVPVTGRNHDAVKRIDLPFSSYKVISHGAVILDEQDKPLASWLAQIQPECEIWLDHMERINSKIQDCIRDSNLKVRSRIIFDYGIPAYISVKSDEADFNWHITELESIFKEFSSQANSRIHINGKNVALMPSYTKKETAVAHLIDVFKNQFDLPLFIGAGDSETDLPFMQLCHYQIKPQYSQIQYENKNG